MKFRHNQRLTDYDYTLPSVNKPHGYRPGLLSAVISSFKTSSTKLDNKNDLFRGSIWQRNFMNILNAMNGIWMLCENILSHSILIGKKIL